MDIDLIREKLALEIAKRQEWVEKLNHSNPGHYGIDDWNVVISFNNIWVDIPKSTFNFKGVSFNFEAQLNSSNENDGHLSNFSKIATGKGIFEFSGTDDITIKELSVEFDLDLFVD